MQLMICSGIVLGGRSLAGVLNAWCSIGLGELEFGCQLGVLWVLVPEGV
jgi:hypothetical protein